MANLLGFMLGVFLLCASISFLTYLIEMRETFFFVWIVAAVVMMIGMAAVTDAIRTEYILSTVEHNSFLK